MKVSVLRIALGASVLIFSTGMAMSDGAPAGQPQPASVSAVCNAGQARLVNDYLYHASTTTRHTNIVRVRYVADHAMPPSRPTALVALASCTNTNKTGSTALN